MENNTQTYSQSTNNASHNCFKKSDSVALHPFMKTVAMAIASLENVTNEIKDKREISKFLSDQLSAYTNLYAEGTKALENIGETAEKVGAMTELMLKGSIKMQTIISTSDTHIADMMIQGTNMGIIEITKTLNDNEGFLSVPAKNLCDKILDTMNKFNEDMKSFL